MTRGAVATFRHPSGSSMERADRCPPSHWLPVDRVESTAAERGNGVHDFIVAFFAAWALDKAAGKGTARTQALAPIPKKAPHRALCEALPVDDLPEGGRLEVAVAYDPRADTARIIGYNIGRAYREHGALPHEVCATADCVGVLDGVLRIYDWKSGWLPVGSWQLRFLALALCRALGMDRARVANWYLREDGRIFEDNDSVAEYDALELDDIADEVKRVLARIESSRAADGISALAGGGWCRYCECKASCRLQVGLVKHTVGMRLEEPLTTEKAAEAWLVLDQVDDAIALMRKGLKEFARTNPFPVGDGKQLEAVDWPSTDVLPAKAMPVLADKYGPAIAELAAPREMSQASIERALRTLNQPLAPLKREALEAIEAAGGLVRSTTPQVRPVKNANAPTMTVIRVEQADGTTRPIVKIGGHP